MIIDSALLPQQVTTGNLTEYLTNLLQFGDLHWEVDPPSHTINFRTHTTYGITETLGEERRGAKNRRASRFGSKKPTREPIRNHESRNSELRKYTIQSCVYAKKLDYVNLSIKLMSSLTSLTSQSMTEISP